MTDADRAPVALAPETMLKALHALRDGDDAPRLPPELPGIHGELAASFNELASTRQELASRLREAEARRLEVEAANEALVERIEQVVQLSRRKSEFLASTSHELRTPLNTILILAKLLSENSGGRLSAKEVEYARTICSSGNDLLAILNDLLDLARIEAGRLSVRLRDVALDEVGDALQKMFRMVAATQGLAFAVEVEPDLPATIRTDRKRLQQILANLLSNAFKYTERGSVTLRIGRADGGWSPGHPLLDESPVVVCFRVVDTGIGIPAGVQKLIFNAFTEAHGTFDRSPGGAGLGLSICCELAKLLGGDVVVSSLPGVGSEFSLLLPLALPAPNGGNGGNGANGAAERPARAAVPPPRAGVGAGAPEAAEATEATEAPEAAPGADVEAVAARREAAGTDAFPGLAGKHVLIIDDDIRNIFALASVLEDSGVVPLTAESGPEGVALLKAHPEVDAVLVDIMMPVVDGYETIRMIRADEARRTLPVVAVTARAMFGDREACLAAGATDYLSKPVNIQQLLALLQVLTAD